jgi:hypothetical protein
VGNDGKTYIINLEKNSINEASESKSLLHQKAKTIIQKCLPYCCIYEDVVLTGCNGVGGRPLKADFLIPDIRVLIEVNGKQHYSHIKYFHKSKSGFDIYKKNDEIKNNWATENNITSIELPYNEIQNWEKIINGKIG